MQADATHSGPGAARNPHSHVNNVLALGSTDPIHPGLVTHPALSPSVQVQILSVIDATGSASLGDIIAELPGHADPVGAVFALIAAQVLVVLTGGIVDANTMVARAGGSLENNGTAPADTPPAPTPLPERSDSRGQPTAIDVSAFADPCLPVDMQLVPTMPFKPLIILGPGARRGGFKHVPQLQQPGVYILLRGQEAYVGYGAEVGVRVALGRQMPDGTPDLAIAIVDAQAGLTDEDGRALERILWAYVSSYEDFTLINGVPDGAPIDPDRYDQLTLFTSQIVLALRQAGLMFLRGAVRARLAGPRTEPQRLGALRRIDALPEGRVRELNYCGLTALAAERDDGSWLLLRGSDVRRDTVSSAAASASFQRAAWLHAGIPELAQDGSCYVLKRDIAFNSGSAVGHFVSGSRGFGLACWRAIDPEEDLVEPAC